MAFILRWFNLVLILVFFVLALIGAVPVPMYTLDLKGVLDQTGTVKASMWDITTTQVDIYVPGTVQSTEVPKIDGIRINFLNCTEERSRFRAMQAFSIAGAVFGFYAFLICLLMCACKLKVKLPLFLFLLLAFACELAQVIVGAVVYTSGACKEQPNAFQSFKAAGYKIGVAYILQIVACAGYLICFIITPFTQDLWCGNC